jgi:hypothetical protein
LSCLLPFPPLGWLVLAGAFAEDAHDVLGGMLDRPATTTRPSRRTAVSARPMVRSSWRSATR